MAFCLVLPKPPKYWLKNFNTNVFWCSTTAWAEIATYRTLAVGKDSTAASTLPRNLNSIISKRSLHLPWSVIPFTNNTQPQAFARLLLQLDGEGVVHILLFVRGLISVERQAHPLWCLSQHIYCFIMCGLSQVNPIHLYRNGTQRVRNQVSWIKGKKIGRREGGGRGREGGREKEISKDHPPQSSLFLVSCKGHMHSILYL